MLHLRVLQLENKRQHEQQQQNNHHIYQADVTALRDIEEVVSIKLFKISNKLSVALSNNELLYVSTISN